MSIKTQPITLTVNGKQYGPVEVPEGLMMIDFLHEYLDLTGSRLGCGQGICHACVAILDHPSGTSEEIRTCITGAHFSMANRYAPSKAMRRWIIRAKWLNSLRSNSRSSIITASSAAIARRALSMRPPSLSRSSSASQFRAISWKARLSRRWKTISAVALAMSVITKRCVT